ncbi:hypothetical protein TNCV_1393931 [Trichonephila clavipes]|nr:hypothetical protein TNCV_1393931 [Trichonephila clavipes]
MGQYDDDEYTLPMRVRHDANKHGCDHRYAVNSTRIHLTNWHLAFSVPRFVVDHNIEDASVCDAASRIAAPMVSELRVYEAANFVEPFVQTLVILQTTSILDSGFVTLLHDPLKSYG